MPQAYMAVRIFILPLLPWQADDFGGVGHFSVRHQTKRRLQARHAVI